MPPPPSYLVTQRRGVGAPPPTRLPRVHERLLQREGLVGIEAAQARSLAAAELAVGHKQAGGQPVLVTLEGGGGRTDGLSA